MCVCGLLSVMKCMNRNTFTFHSKISRASCLAKVICGHTVIDCSILWKDLDQQQCVLIPISKELALESSCQGLGVLVPSHLRLRDSCHLHGEAGRLASLNGERLHLANDPGWLRNCREIEVMGVSQKCAEACSGKILCELL